MALAAAVIFFSLAVVATQSRTGVALLPLALGGALVIWIGDLRDGRIWAGCGILALLALLGYAILRLTPVGHHLLGRFSEVSDDSRSAVWRGTWSAIETFWPVGSGAGGFVPVYKMFEDLDSVTDAWVNHAHNEYLELLLDTGLIGAALFVAYAILAPLALLHDTPPVSRSQRYVGVCAILILMAHSLTDYPLRTFTLLAVFAFANGLLFPAREVRRIRRSGRHPVFPPPAFAMDSDRA
jgi:O-antigen ligase